MQTIELLYCLYAFIYVSKMIISGVLPGNCKATLKTQFQSHLFFKDFSDQIQKILASTSLRFLLCIKYRANKSVKVYYTYSIKSKSISSLNL